MDIRQHMEANLNFIESKEPSADAAYERLRIIRNVIKDLRRAINDTDTKGLSDQHLAHYNAMYGELLNIEAWEMLVVKEGA